MDGRDFGPPRSVHVPPPLLAGLAMEPHRIRAVAAAGRLPPSPGHPPPLHSGKFLPSAINLHPHHSDAFPPGSSPFLSGYPGPSSLTSDPTYRSSNHSSLQMAQLWASHAHEGYPPLPSSLYSSPYLSLSRLETSSLPQHPLYDPHKDGYFMSSSLSQSPLPPPSATSTTPSRSTPPQRTSRDGGRDRTYRTERERDRESERLREETRPHSVVDLTLEGRGEDNRRASRDRDRDKEKDHDADRDRDSWSFHPHQHKSAVESRSRLSPPQPSFPPGGGEGRLHGSEKDRRGREEEGGSRSHHSQNSNVNNSNSHSERQRRNESMATSPGTLHISYVLPPPLQQSGTGLPHISTPREQRVSAPTYVPSVEVYDERVGPIQIASQARDNKHRDRERDRDRELERDGHRERESYRFHEKSLMESHPRLSQSSDVSNQREEGSVICSNGSLGKRSQDTSFSSQSRFSPETTDLSKHSLRAGNDRIGAEPKWSAMSPSANYATNHMAALAAQHGHNLSTPHSQPPQTQKSSSPQISHRPNSSQSSHSHSPQTHGHGCTAEEGSQRRYLDQSGLYRPGLVGSSSAAEHPDHSEVSAMQSLIKYSGNFAAEGPASSRHIIDGRGPFGGLGNIASGGEREKDRERDRDKDRGAMRVPPQLKREQERPDSARSFGREGEGEVRHPPVGIAVAVARQRDSGSSSKQTSGGSDSQRPLLQPAIKDEDRGEERTRHHDERLLAGRLEREQEKVIRETKNLPEFTPMHPAPLSSGLTPSMMTSSLMTPNLMVTGGAALAGAGRWPPDPSTLTSHPWMPRPGAPPVWLSGSPYGLGPSPLHQSLPPGYPPSLPGSLPPPYQFARDPQSGQLIVIPAEHLPHYGGDVLERGAPVWSSVYGTGSSLQHAAQLQLLSQHQILRQQELFMIQQQTAQFFELQRNAQIVERLKAGEHRSDIDDKVDKRSADPKTRASSISSPSPSPVLHPRKPLRPSPSPTPSTSSLTPLPPTRSPVATLKSEEGGHRVLPHAPKLLPASPPSASPPPSSPRRPKQEEGEEGAREQRKKSAAAPFQGIYSDLPPGYPYQSITAPYGSFPPYTIPPSATENTDVHRSCSAAAPLTSTHHHEQLLDAEIKPHNLEPPKAESFQLPQPNLTPEPLGCIQLSRSADRASKDNELDVRAPETSSPAAPQAESLTEVGEEEEKESVIKTELSSNSCQAVKILPAEPAADEPKPEPLKEAELPPYHPSISDDAGDQERPQVCASSEQTAVCDLEQADSPSDSFPPCLEDSSCEPPVLGSPLPLIRAEEPMGGMLALLTASEMARARPGTPPIPTLESQLVDPPFTSDCSGPAALEMVALEGMALLSQMAKNETDLIFQAQDLTLDGLDCLLEASRQILLEAIEKQSHIDLPRTLDPDKKYSWRHRKEEPLYSKMSVDMLDAVEVEYRVRLAELQKTYKEKQRELSKLQRRRDKRERQQEDERRSLTRRGRGRPRKRKHLPTPTKLDGRPGKLGRTVQYSEDSEAGEGQRKRFCLCRDEEDTETGTGGVKKKKKKKSWSDQEPSSTHALEALKAKRGHVCEQEQLASDLDRALSLSQLGSLGASRKLASRLEKSKGRPCESGLKERGVHSSVKGAKLKLGTKASAAETIRKVKGQKKAVFSPMRSELSSCSNNTDSEEHISSGGGWPPHSTKHPRDGSTRKRRSASSPTSLLPSQKPSRKKHKHLSLLLEEAGLSSSDDSFDQGY